MMKKISLLLLVLPFLMFTKCKKDEPATPETQAHFKVTDINGVEIDNNHEFHFQLSDADRNLVLLIENTSDQTIHMKTRLVAVTGTDGSQMEFCFGNCYMGMELNKIYPEQTSLDVSGNSTTPRDAIHYANHTTAPASYTIEIFEVDGDGHQVGNAFRFRHTTQ